MEHIIDLRQLDKPVEADPVKKVIRAEKTRRFWRGLIEWAVYILVFTAIIWGTPKALTIILDNEYPIASITSSSMWPELKEGDIVLIHGLANKYDVKEGDIVVYKNDKGFTIHRIVKLNETSLITKGDANNVDDTPVSYDDLVGKAVEFGGQPFRIPYLGKLSQVMNK